MKFEICAVGSMNNRSLDDAVADYLERIRRYVPADVVEVDSGSAKKGRRREEGRSLLEATSKGAVRVALDENGRQVSSRSLADWIDDQMVAGTRYVSFLIGGAYGLSGEVRNESAWSLSLSTLTLPHEMARLVLAEQLYRAMTIIRGEPYHKD